MVVGGWWSGRAQDRAVRMESVLHIDPLTESPGWGCWTDMENVCDVKEVCRVALKSKDASIHNLSVGRGVAVAKKRTLTSPNFHIISSSFSLKEQPFASLVFCCCCFSSLL